MNIKVSLAIVVSILPVIIFINLLLGKGGQKLTPKNVAELAKKTTFNSPNVGNLLRDIFLALNNMNLDELTEVIHTVSLDDWNRQNPDLRMSILMASTLNVSEKLILKYRHNVNIFVVETEVSKIFEPHPFLLRTVAHKTEGSAESLEEMAKYKIGEEKADLLLEAANLYILTAVCYDIQSTLQRSRLEKPKRFFLKATV